MIELSSSKISSAFSIHLQTVMKLSIFFLNVSSCMNIPSKWRPRNVKNEIIPFWSRKSKKKNTHTHKLTLNLAIELRRFKICTASIECVHNQTDWNYCYFVNHLIVLLICVKLRVREQWQECTIELSVMWKTHSNSPKTTRRQ